MEMYLSSRSGAIRPVIDIPCHLHCLTLKFLNNLMSPRHLLGCTHGISTRGTIRTGPHEKKLSCLMAPDLLLQSHANGPTQSFWIELCCFGPPTFQSNVPVHHVARLAWTFLPRLLQNTHGANHEPNSFPHWTFVIFLFRPASIHALISHDLEHPCVFKTCCMHVSCRDAAACGCPWRKHRPASMSIWYNFILNSKCPLAYLEPQFHPFPGPFWHD